MNWINFFWGLFGILVVCGISFLFSSHKKSINMRIVLSGLLLEIVFAWFILHTKIGQVVLKSISDLANKVISYADKGIEFLFGGLYTEESGIQFVLAFNVLPMIIFFSSLIAVLYYLRIMPLIFKYIGGFLSWALGTTRRESVAAAANIFLGQTESPLVVRPHLPKMTRSEVFTVMVCGLASVAGTMLAAYASLGVKMEYLLAASFMSAPSGLIIAKIFFPEVEEVTEEKDIEIAKDEESSSVIDAASNGAKTGLDIALIVGAALLAFTALIYMANGLLHLVGGWIGLEITIQKIFGYIFSPIAFAIGIPWKDAMLAGTFLGEKIVLTEFIAFVNFSQVFDQLTAKSNMLITFALCGFANFVTMVTCTNTLAALDPKRKKLFMSMSMKSLWGGMLASLLSAAIAGMFFG